MNLSAFCHCFRPDGNVCKAAGEACQTGESLPKATGCWEIQDTGSCFPSLTYGHGGAGRETESVETPDQTEREGVRPGRKKEKYPSRHRMESDGEEKFNVNKHRGQ